MNVKLKYVIVFTGYFLVLYFVCLFLDHIILPAVTSGSASTAVPKVLGLDANMARDILERNDLNMEVTKEIYSTLPAGQVINQIPSPNMHVKDGRIIFVTVSKGEKESKVPYLKGLNIRAAKIALEKAGLSVGDVEYIFSDEYGKDTVAWQQYMPNALLALNTEVSLKVSKGAEAAVKVPNIVGLSLTEAKTILEECGLLVGHITYISDDTFLSDVVVGQSISQGSDVTNGTAIDIKVSK